MTSTIQIRIDKKIKERARKVFKKAGMDLSTGIRCHLCEIAKSRSDRTANGFTSKQENEMLKDIEYTLKYGKSYTSVREMHKDILKS